MEITIHERLMYLKSVYVKAPMPHITPDITHTITSAIFFLEVMVFV